jgi:hypothetical protein
MQSPTLGDGAMKSSTLKGLNGAAGAGEDDSTLSGLMKFVGR